MELVAMPAVPGAVLVVVHAQKGFGLKEGVLDGPAELRDRDHCVKGNGFGRIGEDVLGGMGLMLGFGPEKERAATGCSPTQAMYLTWRPGRFL